jgi:hydrogenase maturation protein HypF
MELGGHVRNTAEGVVIEIEGSDEAIRDFKEAIQTNLPPLARIDTLHDEAVEPLNERDFTILESLTNEYKSAFLPADIALCEACLGEMRDPQSRYYRYPFTTCTNCGPRYTIVQSVPYDRPNTSMAPFAMCKACEAEYRDLHSRRYHAQPLSCPECGPTLRFISGETQIREFDAILKTAEAIKAGKIVAIKGVGGFHLVCDATDEKAVSELRRRKNRPAKPFAVMYKNLEAAEADTLLNEKEKALLTSKERPIVLTVRREETRLAPGVAPGISRLGLFLPYTPVHHLLFDHLDTPVVATSANLSDEPIITDIKELTARMGHVVDAVLDYDREIVNACDDSIVQVVEGRVQMLRLGRGYAPASLKLSHPVTRPVLAVGANQKNSLAIAFGDNVILSPHIGDLNSIEAFGYFEKTLATLQRFYDFTPDMIVCDSHPDYATSRWAATRHLPLAKIQHHHAHILAALLEHDYHASVLGFAFDGTGYGEDGTVWGAEVLLAHRGGYERLYHLRPFRLLGGEKAVKEPRRAALSLLFEQFGLEEVLAMEVATVSAFEPEEIRRLHLMWHKALQAPLASSAGRLFDAAASLIGAAQTLSYEGESGLILESLYDPQETGSYPVVIENGVIETAPIIRAILNDLTHQTQGVIAARFIHTLGEIILSLSKEFREFPVVLAGGVFQNRALSEYVIREFDRQNRRYLHLSRFPVNDGGIAAGQIAAFTSSQA